MKLIKKTAGSVGDCVWEKPGDWTEVPDDLAGELLSLDPSEYAVYEEKAPRKTAKTTDKAAPAADSDSE